LFEQTMDDRVLVIDLLLVQIQKQRSCTTVVRSSRLPLNPREAREMAEGREPKKPNAGGGAGYVLLRLRFSNLVTIL
jgi:hypothetical protein